MPESLPIAIIIPHSGLAIPPELSGRTILSEAQIFNEADIYADLLFDFRDRVKHWLSFPYARALIDVNRPVDETEHHRAGDSAIKRQTSYGAPVYATGEELKPSEIKNLVTRYWTPWHEQLAEIAADPDVMLVFDCHTMAAMGPATYDDPDQRRPRAAAANLGEIDGTPQFFRRKITASPPLTRRFAEELGRALRAVPALAPVGADVAINTPYWGGYDLIAHGGLCQPWLMVEVNRALYIGEQNGDTLPVPPPASILNSIRDGLWDSIVATTHAYVNDDIRLLPYPSTFQNDGLIQGPAAQLP